MEKSLYKTISVNLLLLFLFFSGGLHATRGNVRFERITIREGLSQSSVRGILQDKKGFMWFATVDGLNRYDGYTFKISKPEAGNANSISSPFLRDILQDENGFIWIATNGEGLNRYDPETETFIHYKNDPRNPRSLSFNYVWCLALGRDGRLWLGTDGGGLNCMNPATDSFTVYAHKPGDETSLSHQHILSVCEDGDGKIWAGTRGGGLNRLDPSTGKITRFKHNAADPDSLSGDYVWKVYLDRQNQLWVGTDSGGLNRWIRGTDKFVHYRAQPGKPHSLSNDSVLSIFQDSRGSLWVGTKGGLSKMDLSTEKFTSFTNDPGNPNSLGDDFVFEIYEDRSGVLWLGLETGGVNKLDRNKTQFLHYKKEPGKHNLLTENFIWSIYEDSDNFLWVGTRRSGFSKIDREHGSAVHYFAEPNKPGSLAGNHIRAIYKAPSQATALWIGVDGMGIMKFHPSTGKGKMYSHDPGDPFSLSDNRVYTIHEDRSRRLWVGTRSGGLNRFDREAEKFFHYRHDPNDPTAISNDYVYDILQDHLGLIWVGTFAGGLNLFDPEKETFTSFQNNTDDQQSISSDCVLCIYEDRKGRIWLGTGGGGLAQMHRNSRTFTNYIEASGIPNRVIYGILEDAGGNLWLTTNNGLSRFSPENGDFKNYTEQDGLQSNEFNGGAYFISPRSGEMFFGGINGFTAFYPNRIKDNSYIPPIVITSFLKFNKEVKTNVPITEVNQLTMSYKDYVFSFQFAALDFTVPLKNRYAYKMEGLDEDWISTTAWNRFATYTTLRPGHYKFRVRGSNNDGIWNAEGTSIDVIITPPFWLTRWFIVSALAVLLLLLFSAYKLRTRFLFSRARLETELQTAHDAQMSIMPQHSPQIEGFDIAGLCIPANEVGGDFFDYLWPDCSTGSFGVAVGDVSGKAMKAAMPAVMANGIIHAKACETSSIKEIISRLNVSLFEKTDKRIFTALMLVSIQVKDRRMCFINAGLPEPLLISGDSVTCLPGTGSSFPLGVIADSNYQETQTNLKAGDVVVLYTDGISESWNTQGEFYDTKNLIWKLKQLKNKTAALSAAELIKEIINDIRRFSTGVKQRDDMTIVAIRVK